MELIDFNERKPPERTLVLVWLGDFRGYGLRSFDAEGQMWDENENFDDSGDEPELWAALPTPR